MRLLNIQTLRLEDADEMRRKLKKRNEPPLIQYAIISHVWMDPGNDYQNEILIDELTDWDHWSTKKPRGAAKIVGACRAAREWSNQRKTWEPESNEINHIWLDTCCIDQKNQAEVSMSINSMYRWYKEATVCLVYLSDTEYSKKGPDLSYCKWFSRGWTLQELVASGTAEFYDTHWKSLGSKTSLRGHLARITGINEDVLSYPKQVSRVSISQRMSWASKRETRIEEDGAYSLMGLFGVQMATLYGEGKESAFRRLQEEIIKYSDDHSVFAWLDQPSTSGQRGLLASYPACFEDTGKYRAWSSPGNTRPYSMTNKGLDIDLYLQKHPREDKYIACFDCPIDKDHYLGIFLKCISWQSRQYVRIDSHKFCQVKADGRGELKSIYVKQILDG